MQTAFARLNRMFESTPAALRPYRWLSFALFLAVSAWSAVGIQQHFSVNVTPEAWFEDGAEPVESRSEFRREFGSDESIYIVYEHSSGDVFSETALRTLKTFHHDLEQAIVNSDSPLSRIIDVDSLYNARYQIADGDTLIARELIGKDFPSTSADREARRKIAMGQDGFERVFYSSDFRYGGIRLKTNYGAIPAKDDKEASIQQADDNLLEEDLFGFGLESSLEVDSTAIPEDVELENVQLESYYFLMRALRELTSNPDYADFKFHYVGNPVTMDFIGTSIMEAMGLLMAMVALIVIMLWTLFRSLSAVCWPLLIVFSSILWVLGTGSWLKIEFSSMMVLTFMLVLAVGIASSIHVFSAYALFSREGKNHHDAIAQAYRKTGMPILLTTLTTMIGMLALTLTDMPIITVFGLSSAAAVALVFLLIFTFMPLLLDLWHPKFSNDLAADHNKSATEGKKPLIDIQPLLAKIADFTEAYAKPIVITYFLGFIVLVYAALDLNIDTNFSKLAKKGTPLQTTLEMVDKDMMGGLDLEVMMDFHHSDALQDPAVLKAIRSFQDLVKSKHSDKVIKTFSLADIVEDTNQVMHSDLPSFHRLPDDPLLTAQLLYMFNSASPDDRRDVVSDDYSKSHIAFMLRNAGTTEYKPLFSQLDNYIDEIFGPLEQRYPEMEVKVTGTFFMMMNLMDHVAWTQLKSFSFALLVITLLMMVTLGSYQAGLISMIPNFMPALFTFGVMGGFGIPLDSDTLIVAPIIIGIAVDDTIHFLTHYRYTWLESGDVGVAVRKTLREVGQAVTFTSMILGLGFAILGFAGYLGLAKPGIFGAAAIFVALLSDLLFLPALMHWLKPQLGRKKMLAAEQVENLAN